MKRLALCALLLGACWIDNTHYRAAPVAVERPPADMTVCPAYPPGGGAGLDRPQVLVPGGQYRIGQMTYAAADFYLDVFLVTVGAYRECMSGVGAAGPAGGCTRPGAVGICNWSDDAGSKEEHPINCVTQAQAQAFCQWAGRRLPSEGEWQYAAQGPGMKSAYPWGDDSPLLDSGIKYPLCWAGTSMDGTCPVGSFSKTLLGSTNCDGVADLAGEVWEWTGSEFHDPYVYPEPACAADSQSCALRGGSWGNDDDAFFTATYRYGFDPSLGLINFGFRCARTR